MVTNLMQHFATQLRSNICYIDQRERFSVVEKSLGIWFRRFLGLQILARNLNFRAG